MDIKTINVGIAGFGAMGKTHAACVANLPFFYQNLPFIARIAGVCTSSPAHTESVCKSYGFEKAYASFDEMLLDPKIDVIDVCLPNNLHYEAVMKAIRAGKHVLCEKPLAFDLKQAQAIASLSQTQNKIYGMVFNNRFLPAVLRAKELIDENKIGRLLSFRFVYHHNSCIDPLRTRGWKQDKNVCGGGTLFDLGSHVIDLSNYLCGPVETVFGTSQIAFSQHPDASGTMHETNADEAFYMIAKTADGAVGTIESSKITVGANDDLSFSVQGTAGAVHFSLMDPDWLYFYDASLSGKTLGGTAGFTKIETVGRYAAPGGTFPSPKAPIGWLRGHIHSYYSFLNAVYAGLPFTPSFEDGLYVQRVMDAAMRSAESGRWEQV